MLQEVLNLQSPYRRRIVGGRCDVRPWLSRHDFEQLSVGISVDHPLMVDLPDAFEELISEPSWDPPQAAT